jgi:carbonic anhydrase/acetyltransferase-like protein (isoleucine patch superfamily)
LRAFITGTETRISPFDEHPQRLLVLNTPLQEHQKMVLSSLGISLGDPRSPTTDEEALIFNDTLFFTRALLQTFLDESRRPGKPSQCVLKRGAMTARTVASTMDVSDIDGNVGYRLYYYPRGSKIENRPQPILIDPDEYVDALRFPVHMVKDGRYLVPITRKLLVQVEHWANLWAANVYGVLSYIADLKFSKLKLFSLVLRSLSSNPWKVSAHNVVLGRRCDVHPTAYLENSVVGDGVEIGARSVVRGSLIGKDTVIANNVNISYSVIGERCNIRDRACIHYSVLYPAAFVASSSLNHSFVGRDALIGYNAVLTDFRLDGRNVMVTKGGKPIDSGQTFLGGCLGHGVDVGSGAILAPGREVPNNTAVVPTGTRVVARLPSLKDASEP